MPAGRLILAAFLVVAGCGGPLEILTGGGPNVAANVQAGAENTQGLRASEDRAQRVESVGGDVRQSADENRVRSERVERVVINERVPPWLWVVMVIAWLLDSPARWGEQIAGAFKRRRHG